MPVDLDLEQVLTVFSDESRRDEFFEELLTHSETVTDENGASLKVLFLRDATIPEGLFAIMKKRKMKGLHSVRNFNIRNDDVFVLDYAKSGTHWLCNLIYFMLQKGDLTETTSHQPPLLEMFDEEMINAKPSPRVLTSHLLPTSVPKQIFTNKSKVILLYRNPKDTAVSLFYHLHKITESLYNLSWNCHVTNFMAGKAPMADYFQHYLTWEKHIRDNPNHHILLLSYEQLKKTPLEALRKVSVYLGLDLSDERLAQIMRKCSLENLKKDVDTGAVKTPLVDQNGKSTLYRKGIIGDWKTHFTVAQNEQMDAVIDSKMPKDTMYKFEYS